MSGGDSESASKTNVPVLGSIITIIIVVLVVTTTVNYSAPLATGSSTPSPSSTTSSTTLSALTWSASTSYPVSIWTQSCVSSSEYVYCVGGTSGAQANATLSAVYYAPLTASGVGPWAATTSYPTGIRSESCVARASTIYCVGGVTSSAISDGVYSATLSSQGVGKWDNTTRYPFPVWSQSCVASDSGIYCVGGSSPALPSTSAVYFAPFSSSGLGKWSVTTSYPVAVKQHTCLATAADLYCIGGYLNTDVYYAPLTSSGLGQWTNTTGYPFTVGANLLSCATVSSSVYCIGGHTGPNVSNGVYRATLSAAGVSQWLAMTNYPQAVWGESCVNYGKAIYCVGGETAAGSVTGGVSFSSVG